MTAPTIHIVKDAAVVLSGQILAAAAVTTTIHRC